MIQMVILTSALIVVQICGKVVHMSKEYPDEDYPCDNCPEAEFCDGWEARYCCTLCEYYGGRNCDDCDPMDI